MACMRCYGCGNSRTIRLPIHKIKASCQIFISSSCLHASGDKLLRSGMYRFRICRWNELRRQVEHTKAVNCVNDAIPTETKGTSLNRDRTVSCNFPLSNVNAV